MLDNTWETGEGGQKRELCRNNLACAGKEGETVKNNDKGRERYRIG